MFALDSSARERFVSPSTPAPLYASNLIEIRRPDADSSDIVILLDADFYFRIKPELEAFDIELGVFYPSTYFIPFEDHMRCSGLSHYSLPCRHLVDALDDCIRRRTPVFSIAGLPPLNHRVRFDFKR